MSRITRRQLLQSLMAATPVAVAGSQSLLRSAGATSRQPYLVAQAPATIRYTLSWLPSSIDTPLIVGINKGYFADEGIQVTYERGFGSADSITKIAAGQYDLGEGDPYSMIEFMSRNPDADLVAVYAHFNRSPFGIYSLKSSGITTPQALAGKRMGAPAGDAPRRLWPVFANAVGVDPDSVEWTSMAPPLRAPFLVQGQVDAISGFMTSALPDVVQAGAPLNEVEVFLYNDYGLDIYGNAIITTRTFARENPEQLEGFLRAYVKGWQETLANPDASLLITLDEARANAQVLNPSIEKLRMDISRELLFATDEVMENGLGDVIPERFDRSIEQVVAGFGLETRPSVEDVFDGSFLPPRESRMLMA